MEVAEHRACTRLEGATSTTETWNCDASESNPVFLRLVQPCQYRGGALAGGWRCLVACS